MKNKIIKIKTNLCSGIILGVFSAVMLALLTSQVRVPAYDNGSPSPRIIPGICLVCILALSIILIVQSLIFKKEKIYEFDWSKEKPVIIMIALLLIFVTLTNIIGFILSGIIIFPIILFYCGERKPFIYIFTVIAVIATYYLFMKVFHVSLPEAGILGSILPGLGG